MLILYMEIWIYIDQNTNYTNPIWPFVGSNVAKFDLTTDTNNANPMWPFVARKVANFDLTTKSLYCCLFGCGKDMIQIKTIHINVAKIPPNRGMWKSVMLVQLCLFFFKYIFFFLLFDSNGQNLRHHLEWPNLVFP